ncbi:Short-chain-enoyl-CoA hydratase (Fragment) [Geodia barretti]|uniref:Short-chain-enoyl-CoA hydratase n=1 Tax=Geodia barretti TaxID=519541 RepID=A0AA35T059_GEOBA
MACDIRIAAENARMGVTEVRLGFMPASGGTQRLARLVGAAKALEMCLSGALVDAQEAYRIGLVNKLVPAGELTRAGEEMADPSPRARHWPCGTSRNPSARARACRWTKRCAWSPISPRWSSPPTTARKGRGPSSKAPAGVERPLIGTASIN